MVTVAMLEVEVEMHMVRMSVSPTREPPSPAEPDQGQGPECQQVSIPGDPEGPAYWPAQHLL